MDLISKKISSDGSNSRNYFYSKAILYGVLTSAAIFLSKKMIKKYIDVKNRTYLNNNTNTPSTSIKVQSNRTNKDDQYGVLPERSPSEGNACKFLLKGINRDSSGMVGGLSSFCCEDVGLDDVSFESLMHYDNLCLYCIDFKRDLLVFLEISNEYVANGDALNSAAKNLEKDRTTSAVAKHGPSPRHVLLTLPFFDRGVRKLATSHVYVVSFSTAWKYFTTNKSRASLNDESSENSHMKKSEEYPNVQSTTSSLSTGFSASNAEPNNHCPIYPDRGNVIYVWNTGRCGSTLLHRILIEMGVASLSEPYWLEQISMSRWNQELDLSNETVKSYFWLCQNIDFSLAGNNLYPSSKIYALDPKAFGHWMLPFVLELNPHAKHIFLYRDCISVIESFQSIFFYETPWFKRNYQLIKSYFQNFLFSYKYILISQTLTKIIQDRYLPLPLPSKPGVAKSVMRWVDCILTVKEFKDADRFYPGHLLIYRFEEFVKKDLTHRKKLLKQLYSFIHGNYDAGNQKQSNINKPTDDDISHLLPVFDSHSQKGDRMEKSSSLTGRKYLNWSDKLQIRLLLQNIPDIKSSDFILPGSELI